MSDWLKSVSLIFIPAYLYLVSYKYEAGYLSYFGFSKELVELSPEIFVTVSGYLISYFASIFCCGFYLLYMTKAKNFNQQEEWLLFLLFAWILPGAIFSQSIGEFLGKFGFFIFTIFVLYALFPLIFEKGPLRERPEKFSESCRKQLEGTLFIKFVDNVNFYKLMAAIFFIIYLPGWADDMGKFVAGRSGLYNVFSPDKEYVVIRNYDTKLLVVELEEEQYIKNPAIFFPESIDNIQLKTMRAKLLRQEDK